MTDVQVSIGDIGLAASAFGKVRTVLSGRTDDELLRMAAAAIRESLTRVETLSARVDFIALSQSYDRELSNLRAPRPQALIGLWAFALQYFYQLDRKSKNMGGLPWDEARRILLEAVDQVERGDVIDSPIILEFGQPVQMLTRLSWKWLRAHKMVIPSVGLALVMLAPCLFPLAIVAVYATGLVDPLDAYRKHLFRIAIMDFRHDHRRWPKNVAELETTEHEGLPYLTKESLGNDNTDAAFRQVGKKLRVDISATNGKFHSSITLDPRD